VTVIVLPLASAQKRTRADDVARCGSTVLLAASEYNLSDLMAGPIPSFGLHHTCGGWPPVPHAGAVNVDSRSFDGAWPAADHGAAAARSRSVSNRALSARSNRGPPMVSVTEQKTARALAEAGIAA
jgi:hypothetical protein